MKKAQKRGLKYEKTQAKKHRGRHLGGPGKPDYTRGKKTAEVKHWSQPVHSGVIKKALQKGIKEIVSNSGFTEPAKELVKKEENKTYKSRTRSKIELDKFSEEEHDKVFVADKIDNYREIFLEKIRGK